MCYCVDFEVLPHKVVMLHWWGRIWLRVDWPSCLISLYRCLGMCDPRTNFLNESWAYNRPTAAYPFTIFTNSSAFVDSSVANPCFKCDWIYSVSSDSTSEVVFSLTIMFYMPSYWLTCLRHIRVKKADLHAAFAVVCVGSRVWRQGWRETWQLQLWCSWWVLCSLCLAVCGK